MSLIVENKNKARIVNQEAPARTRALQNPLILREIANAVSPHELRTLGHVDRAFYEIVHTPPVWARQYSPASIDWPARTVVTTLDPLSSDGIRKAYENASRPTDLRRSLGRCSEETWYLKYEKGEKNPVSAAMANILDKVTVLRYEGLYTYSVGQTADQGFQLVLAENREKAYTFMKDRLYRLEHNLPVPIYTSGAKQFFALGVVVASSILGAIKCESKASKAENIFASVTYTVGLFSCVGAATLGGLCIGLGLTFGGESAIRNMVIGPVDYHRINRWARELPRLEAIEKKESD